MNLPMAESELPLTVSKELPQVVPSSTCFNCDVCCRFPEAESVLRPYFTREEIVAATAHGMIPGSFPDPAGSQVILAPSPAGEGYLCPAFDPATGRCGIYEVRPLDCQLYPLALMWDEAEREVLLGWDTKCPFTRESIPQAIAAHAERVDRLLATEELLDKIASNPRLVGRFQDDVVVLKRLPKLAARLLTERVDARLHPLTVSDAPRFAKALEQAGVLRADAPAAYAFPYHYIWKSLLPYWWLESRGTFFLFAQSADGWFLPLMPLGPRPLHETVTEAFLLMQQWNGCSPVSRIENVAGFKIPEVTLVNLQCRRKEGDYLYRAEPLAALSGDPYKSQRALCNRIDRARTATLEQYGDEHRAGCLALHERWVSQKREGALDPVGAMLLQDAAAAHVHALAEHAQLGLNGTVVMMRDTVVAYTFGYWLTPETWCILLEVADRSIPGLAQWLFRETCRTAIDQGAIYINTMDDAGLLGLRNAKLAYHPASVVENWVITGL